MSKAKDALEGAAGALGTIFPRQESGQKRDFTNSISNRGASRWKKIKRRGKNNMSTPVVSAETQLPDSDGRCHGTNKQGQPCGARATVSGYCYMHTHPEKAAELGRAGGRQNRHAVDGLSTPLPALDSVPGVTAAIAQTIVDVHAKRLSPRIATGVAPLFNILLRSLDTEEQEKRLKSLGEKIKKLQNEAGDRFSAPTGASAGSSGAG